MVKNEKKLYNRFFSDNWILAHLIQLNQTKYISHCYFFSVYLFVFVFIMKSQNLKKKFKNEKEEATLKKIPHEYIFHYLKLKTNSKIRRVLYFND